MFPNIYFSAIEAHAANITHPMNVQPRNKLITNIPPMFFLPNPIIEGRKLITTLDKMLAGVEMKIRLFVLVLLAGQLAQRG
jgi:hypothetical protein